MGNQTSQAATPPAPLPEAVTPAAEVKPKPPKCKACCACPQTKLARDDCIMEKGVENCAALIEAHKRCMRDMGFDI